MKTVTIYEYDRQLRPRTLGADFEDGDPNHSYTLRFEEEERDAIMLKVLAWIYGGYE